jgi:ABC-type dipeptide/oligopeptide/nickel transport system ATPase component
MEIFMIDQKEITGYVPVYGIDDQIKEKVIVKTEHKTNWIQLILLCGAWGFVVSAYFDFRYKGKDTQNLENQIEQLRKQNVENQKTLEQLRGLLCPTP